MKYRFGAIPHAKGVSFGVWAPAQSSVALVLEGERDRPMQRRSDGFFTLDVAETHTGQRYWYRLAQGLRPDPASRFQPEGPLGPSQIVDTRAFDWRDQHSRGAVPRHRHVIYEMHIGTFTKDGTWAAATARLPYLVELGVTTLELMPLAEFAGAFGWGYDGVDLFAPAHIYGTPHDAQRFVDEAHRLGLCVILDVVYNHFGPVGNFFVDFSETVHGGAPSEWGDSINYDGEGSCPVRQFMMENAAYWIREFHFDGLRLDATHGIHDTSEQHIVSDICRAAREAAAGRELFIVAESEPQDTQLLKGVGAQADGVDAIWNEDWHHAAFVALTGRRQGYFTDYRGTAPEFASMAQRGPLYQGQWYTWQKQHRGGFAIGLSSSHFVSFLENHDQVANTGLGARLFHQVDLAEWRAMTALLLLGPGLPMLFQGQEFGSSRPFAYFAEHEGELAQAVEKGRIEFLSQFAGLATAEMRLQIPKPADRRTFEMSKLDDEERTTNNALFRLHSDLLRLRKTDAVLAGLGTDHVRVEASAPTAAVLLLRYLAPSADRLLVVNLADDHLSPMNDPLLAPRPSGAWTSMWSSEHPLYGGRGVVDFALDGRWLIPGRSATLLGPGGVPPER
jgi:maltooligosyltrehalose trehalohydrolase